jgi:hypothetical protein
VVANKKRGSYPSSCPAPNCPSWARAAGGGTPTRTLLIQSPLALADISDNLLGFGHLLSIGARFPAVVCALVPGETTGKTTAVQLDSSAQGLAAEIGGGKDQRHRLAGTDTGRCL